ncbi:hypothetical protein [Mycobacterium sp. Marseille-P9652]|uniref:hypothetical protein n=1 Tax=Mycobacterium sp. Marseille-P9652 TaxID=2654950 RepID=UPI001E4AADD2|nr:hypothetical protein [Mycobacterium sp. Marseille-P9652]
MDVVLGVAVTGPVARLALVGAGARGADVIDQSVVNLDNHPIDKLTETVVGTNRLLADEAHRLVATRVIWPDGQQADQLRRALEDSGVHNVAVLSESQAATALMRAAGRAGGVLVVDDETATLSVVGGPAGDTDAPPTMLASQPLAAGDATGALDTMMARLPDASGDLYVVGASPDLAAVADQLRGASTMRVEIPEDPTFALARGAALAAAPEGAPAGDATALAPALGDATAMAPAAGLAGDATTMAPAAGLTGDETAFAPAADPAASDQQLAYSMAGEGEPFGADDYDDLAGYDELDEADGVDSEQARLSRRSLLIGNAVIAFAVIGFASLAAAVAIAIRPTAATQPVVGHQNAAPGKFMPLLPTQQQAPVPAPPIDTPNAGYQGGTIPAPSVPQQVAPPVVNGTPAAPVGPETPGTPGFVPNPDMPIPVPVIVPFPGWRPPYPYNPYNPYPPYTPPTTTVSPPTTSVAPPTTSVTPPTTSVAPPTTTVAPPTTTVAPPTTTAAPTTTYSPPTTSYSPPTTSYAPPTTTQAAPPTTSYSPPPTTYSPPPTHTQTQQQTVPPQTHTQAPVTPQQPVVPQQPHTGGGGTGGGSTGGGGTGGSGTGGGHHGFGF